jgi:HTH-type transcriptional regulator / antitoxin HigA
MATNTALAKALLSPPGDTIQETIDEMGMSQAELAERMGRPKEKINDIIKGREPISTITAFQLDKVLGIPAGFWMNREREYREQLYKIEQEEWLEQCEEWLKAFPVREMRKNGWLSDSNDKGMLTNDLLKFFAVASPDEWRTIYLAEKVSVAFRISLASTSNPYAISAWLRKGEIQAMQLALKPFSKKQFRSSLDVIKEMSWRMPVDFAMILQQVSSEAGVAVVYTPNLPGAPISGATRWVHNKPVIQLSGRFKTSDHFWFTFFHEAGHLLLHGKKDVFLENVEGISKDSEKEQEANEFAARTLINDSDWKNILDQLPLMPFEIEKFADQLKVDKGVIVGRLQHETQIAPSAFNDLKTKIDLFGSGCFG